MSDSKFPVKFITTNTRLGFVDVKALCDKAEEHCDREGEPDNIYHSAIVAYGFVYEYVFDAGITITDEKTYISQNSPIWYDGDFETEKTQKEFESWVADKKQVIFSEKNYHVSDNNCSHFTRDASVFLGGKEPEKHSSQRNWLIRNRHIAVVIQGLLEASRRLKQLLANVETEDNNCEAKD